jgi:hypothetical protein
VGQIPLADAYLLAAEFDLSREVWLDVPEYDGAAW